MKTNRRGFLKGSSLAAGLAALWAVDPSRILKKPEEEPEEVEAQEEKAPEEYEMIERHVEGPYFLAGGVSIRSWVRKDDGREGWSW